MPATTIREEGDDRFKPTHCPDNRRRGSGDGSRTAGVCPGAADKRPARRAGGRQDRYHLGIRQFFFFGNCIGGPFAMKLMERAPQRVVAALLSQPVGHRPEQPDYMFNSGRDVWAKEFRERQRDVPMETIDKYLHSLYRVRPDFVYSVSRDFAKSCQTPMLVLPDDVTAHPLQVSIDIASLAPNAEITVFPWKDPPELKARTINRARTFLKRHLPA